MTPHDPQPPDDPLEWLSRAQGNLLRAQTFVEGFFLEDLCFDAQQAAEKSIKADLLTTYAVETRYPGADPVSKSEYEDAVAIAEAVVNWATEKITPPT